MTAVRADILARVGGRGGARAGLADGHFPPAEQSGRFPSHPSEPRHATYPPAPAAVAPAGRMYRQICGRHQPPAVATDLPAPAVRRADRRPGLGGTGGHRPPGMGGGMPPMM